MTICHRPEQKIQKQTQKTTPNDDQPPENKNKRYEIRDMIQKKLTAFHFCILFLYYR